VLAGIGVVVVAGAAVQYYRLESARELILAFYDHNDRVATASLREAQQVRRPTA
jgi:hypothetical protein